jgi:hypothetical protein
MFTKEPCEVSCPLNLSEATSLKRATRRSSLILGEAEGEDRKSRRMALARDGSDPSWWR